MSTNTEAATHYLQFYIQWASIALLFYDYALTFSLEVKYMWKFKYQHSAVLYVFCRYALLGNVLYLLAIAGKLSASCDTVYKFIGALSSFGRAAVIVTLTIRTYVVCNRSRKILAYLSVLGLACIVLHITHVLGLKCVGSSTNEILSILMVVFEYSAAILTTVRCIQELRLLGMPWREHKTGLYYLIFEQGILYFSFISLFTTAAIVLNFRAPSGFFQRLLNAMTLPLSGLFTARFLLHLHCLDGNVVKRSLRLDGISLSSGFDFPDFTGSIHTQEDIMLSSLNDLDGGPSSMSRMELGLL